MTPSEKQPCQLGCLGPVSALNQISAKNKETKLEPAGPNEINNFAMETLQDEDGQTNTAKDIGQFILWH